VTSVRFWTLWCGVSCLCLFLAGGCASRLPRTLAVSDPELDQGQRRLSRFLDKPCAGAVDADVRLRWQAYGRQGTYPATLQAMLPSLLRLAVVDPLGRPVVLLVMDGDSFSLVDNRSSEGYTGALDSDFIGEYLPAGISGQDLFLWLSGRIRSRGLQVLSIRKAEQGDLFWYEVDYGDRLIHLLGLNRDSLIRHLVLDEEEKIMVDVRYMDYQDSEKAGDCSWPGKIEVCGQDAATVLSLEFTRIYGFSLLQQQLFHLRFPAYFTVHRVE